MRVSNRPQSKHCTFAFSRTLIFAPFPPCSETWFPKPLADEHEFQLTPLRVCPFTLFPSPFTPLPLHTSPFPLHPCNSLFFPDDFFSPSAFTPFASLHLPLSITLLRSTFRAGQLSSEAHKRRVLVWVFLLSPQLRTQRFHSFFLRHACP